MSGRQLLRPRPVRGEYDDIFWGYVAAHELRLQTCADCGYRRFPPGPACPQCLSEDAAWVAVSGRARVLSWVVFHRQYFAGIDTPHCVVAGQLEEGPIVLADLQGNDPAGLGIDDRLEIVFDTATSADDDGDWVIYRWSRSAVASASQGAPRAD